jgi:hypothetical protein
MHALRWHLSSTSIMSPWLEWLGNHTLCHSTLNKLFYSILWHVPEFI